MKTTFHAVAPGVSVAAHELEFSQSRGEEKSLLVLSALGLCALAYKPFAEAFIDASSRDGNDPDDGAPSLSAPSYRRVVFLDLRHHGESKTEDESSPSYLAWTREYLWDTLSADLRAAVRSLNFPPSSPPDVLAHCLGAGVAALAAAPAPGLFGSLFLFEPPFYPLVAAAPVAEEEEGKGRRDVAKDNASFAASAAAASALSFGSREDAFSLLEVAPPFKWWHESCKRAFVEHGLRRGGEGEGGEKRSEELVFSCGGQALAALASGLLTSSGGGPSRETYRALGAQAQAQQQQQRRGRSRVVVISYSAEPRSDITAFLRDGSRLQ